ncbi:MAG: hypothetical protein RQ745_04145 [Longimicrobiales bacterium]|nr:hypothetical protein [Longimicrobiales bacterium]
MTRIAKAAVSAAAWSLLISTAVHAQSRLVPGDTVMVRPERQYEAGLLHRWILGTGYRDLWSLEIPVPVLDLDTWAGGLTPLRLGGGQQTQSIRFQGADGLVYNFRSVDKDAARGLIPALQKSIAADVMQDQISSLLPLSAMVVAPLLDAAGLFHPGPALAVMPDDPRLGEYRDDFAGVLGWIELRPDEGEDGTPGFVGSGRVVGTDRLYERLEDEPDNFVDQRALLKARLMDFLVGDWDRHPDQWRWAGFPDTIAGREVTLFQPVPRDRDWALARLDGVIQTVASIPWPYYVGFDHDYPDPVSIAWTGRGIDRRLLSELDSADFADVAAEVIAAITDPVIESAVRQLPEAYLQRVGDALERNLKNRRDDLGNFSERYYDLLARWVDVDATDDGEEILFDRHADSSTTLTIFDLRDGEPRPEPYFRRTFRPSHTEEVRLYAHGGDDRIIVRGAGEGAIRLRILGEGGDDVVRDETSGRGVYVYDARGENRFELGLHASLDEEPWEDPDDSEAERLGARPRDWGTRWIRFPTMGANPDDGFSLGFMGDRFRYAFRHFPWAERIELSGSIGTATWRPAVAATWETLTPGQRWGTKARLSWYGSRADRFHGFGNETETPGDDDLFRARRSELSMEALGVLRGAPGLSVEAGPRFRRMDTFENEGTLAAQVQPFGYGEFKVFDLVSRLRIDRRDNVWQPRSGALIEIAGSLAPEALDLVDTYGALSFNAAGYLSSDSLPFAPTLALQLRGRRVFGTYPYFDGAALGGAESLRGFRNQRFLGDGSLASSSELRGEFGGFNFLFPGDIGFLFLVDTGRVWLEGESSSQWHTGVGGGLWVTLVESYSASITVAGSDEHTGVYFTLGMPF